MDAQEADEDDEDDDEDADEVGYVGKVNRDGAGLEGEGRLDRGSKPTGGGRSELDHAHDAQEQGQEQERGFIVAFEGGDGQSQTYEDNPHQHPGHGEERGDDQGD